MTAEEANLLLQNHRFNKIISLIENCSKNGHNCLKYIEIDSFREESEYELIVLNAYTLEKLKNLGYKIQEHKIKKSRLFSILGFYKFDKNNIYHSISW